MWGKGVVEKNDFGGSEHTQYYVRRKGQFIYSKLDFLNSAFGVIPKNLDNYESTADLPAFDLNGMNPYFMFFTAIQKSFYFKYGSIADGSRKAKRIHANTFLDMPVMVPTMEEQTLIVECLQSLDHLITLHQREGCPGLSQLESGVNWFSLTHVLEYHYGSICTNCVLGKHHQSSLNRI
ncbi:MAG: restriction endonuclease subunit S [Butyricicoccus pullicaecorum]|nr:restriction endonuclease subunit S [Butyricicoccus pullicaecorum]